MSRPKRPKSEVICAYCKTPFLKETGEINRSVRLGRKHLCSMLCTGKYAALCHHGDTQGFGFYSNLTQRGARAKNLEYNLDGVYLKDLFNDQRGLCALTGILMKMNHNRIPKEDKSPYYASVDRINNSKGYVKGNVQFVCLGINYMRNTFSIELTKEFLKSIKGK